MPQPELEALVDRLVEESDLAVYALFEQLRQSSYTTTEAPPR